MFKQLIPWGISLLLILLIGWQYFNVKEKATNSEILIEALNAKLKTTTDKLGRVTTSKQTIEADRKHLLEVNSSQSQMIARLQETVKENKKASAAIVFKAEHTGKASGVVQKIEPVTVADTVYPVYTSHVSSPTFDADVKAGPDSIVIENYKHYSEYAITQQSEGRGFLKRKKKVVYIKSLDKGGKVVDMASWQVQEDKKNPALTIVAIIGAFIGGLSL